MMISGVAPAAMPSLISLRSAVGELVLDLEDAGQVVAWGDMLGVGSSGRHHQHLRVRRLFNGLMGGLREGLREREKEHKLT